MSNALLAVQPRGGLGNRLRVISSFALLARHTGRALRVYWARDDIGFSDERLRDLFENEFLEIDGTDFDDHRANGIALDQVVRPTQRRHQREWPFSEGHSVDDIRDLDAHPVVTYRGFLRLDGVIGPPAADRLVPGFGREFVVELRTWRPVAPIREAVVALSSAFDAHTVGVHVRRGDALFDVKGRPRARRSPDRGFFERMDRYVREEPGTSFFLATDDEATERKYRQRYQERLTTNAAKRFVPSPVREPKDNQRDAVIDLFTLARTARVLGSNASSFSSAAADIGGIPLEVVNVVTVRDRLASKRRQLRRPR